MFYVFNIILLVVLMVFLILMVYRFLVDFGEKIGYFLIVLLVYVVYLILILDNIFSILVFVCYLSKSFLNKCNFFLGYLNFIFLI